MSSRYIPVIFFCLFAPVKLSKAVVSTGIRQDHKVSMSAIQGFRQWPLKVYK